MKGNLPPIPYGKTPVVFLIGSGVLQAFGGDSWDSFLNKIKCVKLSDDEVQQIKKLPYPMRPVVLTGNRVDEQLRKFVTDNAKEVNNRKYNAKTLDLIHGFCNLNPDAILTTNYTYEIECSLMADFSVATGKSHKYRKKAVDLKVDKKTGKLHQYFEIPTETATQRIWHIHGELAKPNTMIIGHYYYCELTSMIQQYIHQFIRRYQYSQKHKTDFIPQSWVDYFMIGDVYTIGFGLGVSELDIWWLINCKKRHGSQNSGVYFWDANIADEKKLLAEAYGVNVHSDLVQDGEFPQFYEGLRQRIQSRLAE